MKVREARLTDLKNLSVLFNSYRMFYGKKSDLKVAEEFLRSRIEKKTLKYLFVILIMNYQALYNYIQYSHQLELANIGY